MAETPSDPQRQPQPTNQPLSAEARAGGQMETPQEIENRKERDKSLHETEASAAVTAGVGLGCLSLATLPWSIFALVLVFLAILGFMKSCFHN